METPSFIRREKSLSKYVDGLDPYETLKKRKKIGKGRFGLIRVTEQGSVNVRVDWALRKDPQTLLETR